jgi:tripartite-type tricarboxylate transporter receptor subunit TctC
MLARLTSLAAAAAIAATVGAPAAQAAEPFYKGKTLNLIVGFSPGGGSDITCRLFANHLARYVEGHPTIVVRNMAGAGGLKAMNYVGEAAKPDGLTSLCGAVNTLAQLLGDKAMRVDLTKFNFIAGIPESQVFYVRSDVKPGIKKPEDIFKADGLIFGGFRANSSKDLLGRTALDLLGVKYKYVTGVRGDGAGRKHIQQGFLNAWLEGMGSFISVSEGTLVKTGIVTPIFQLGQADSMGKLSKRNSAIPGIPTFYEIYKAHFGKEPSGPEWNIYTNLAGQIGVALRGLTLPPGSPEAAVGALRVGFVKMLKDQKFWADARKGLGESIDFTPGAETQAAFVKSLSAPQSFKTFLASYVNKGEQMARK